MTHPADYDNFSPLPEGRFGDQSRAADSDDAFIPVECPQETLGDLAKEFVFFSTGIWHTKFGLRIDPVQEFVNSCSKTPLISHLNLDWKVFDNLVDPITKSIDWCYRILSCHRSVWPSLRAFLSSVGFRNNDRKIFSKAFFHRIKVVDRTALRSVASVPDRLPYFTVVVFSASGNHEGYYMESADKIQRSIANKINYPLRANRFFPKQQDVIFSQLVLHDEEPTDLMIPLKVRDLVWDDKEKRFKAVVKDTHSVDQEYQRGGNRKLFSDLLLPGNHTPGRESRDSEVQQD